MPPGGLSSPSCRRLQANSLCSPELTALTATGLTVAALESGELSVTGETLVLESSWV